MTPRYVKPGEPLAMRVGHLYQDRRGFFWLPTAGPTPNERRGDVMLVHVRGELEHHASDAMGCESYEAIRQRFGWALDGKVDGDEDADDKGGPPRAVVLVIDSPGGVVAGLNETVRALRKVAAAHPEVRTIAYCNETAASAAYAIACACAEIHAPPSAIVGSIGVISTMVSQSARDKRDGFDVRLLTSGARKADGNPYGPITDKAVQVEQGRVEKLADAFFRLVSKSRGLALGKIRNLEAGIFLGRDARNVGLVDEVQSLDATIAEANAEPGVPAPGGNQTQGSVRMNLKALIQKTKSAIATEEDPDRIARLAADLAAYKKTEKHIEHVKTEEGDEDAEGEPPAEEDEPAPAEKGKDAEIPDDEDEDEDEGDEAKAAKAALAFVRGAVPGKRGKAALAAVAARVMGYDTLAKRVADLERNERKDAKAALIEGARGKYLTRAEAAWLEKQSFAVVKSFVEDRKATGYLVHTDETTLVKAKAPAQPGTEEELPPATVEMINAAVAAWTGDRKAYRASLVTAHLAEHRKQINTAMNGAGGRY